VFSRVDSLPDYFTFKLDKQDIMNPQFNKLVAIGTVLVAYLLSGCAGGTSDKTKNKDSTKITAQQSTAAVDTIAKLKSMGLDPVKQRTIVGAGQSYPITTATATFLYLEMGDNSKLIIDPSLPQCTITIYQGVFGANTQIIADGKNGNNVGPNLQDPWVTLHGWWQADSNTAGSQGVPGLTGEAGGSGQNISVSIGFNSVEALAIHANGGHGGNGSNGGTGQYAGRKHGLGGHEARGGQGGGGGGGGAGGNGGSVVLQYWFNNNVNPDPTTQQLFTTDAAPGGGGTGGYGGAGGASNQGGAGPIGPNGARGADGKRGTAPNPQLITKPATIFALRPLAVTKAP
jgi:hypothetical protein